jgi:hypothetical protein
MHGVNEKYNILVGKPEGKRPLKRSGHRWKVDIRLGIRKIVWEGMDWMLLVQDGDQWPALMNIVMNFWIP